MTGEIEPAAAGRHDGYDGFISYSHAADGMLAPRLQSGLQRFAKPWWKRRAVRIFRDESSLSANPHLWSSITEALDSSGWFVLLLSPDAARSEWVNQEIDYWRTNRGPGSILPVVTDGEFGWAKGDVIGNAVPDALQGVFTEEPRWVDVRWARDKEHLDLQDPRFADAVADIASTIRGIPKDDLASEEVKQHRRTIRTAWAGGILITLLAVAAVGASIQSAHNATEAERQAQTAARQADIAEANAAAETSAREDADRNAERADREAEAARTAEALARARELAASAIGVVDTNPELATLLSLQAIRSAPSGDLPVEVVNALWKAGSENRLIDTFESGEDSFVAITEDASVLAIIDQERVVGMDPETGDTLWVHTEATTDRRTSGAFSVDDRLAFGVIDSGPDGDDLPNRVLILDGATGEELHRIEFPDCDEAEIPEWSTGGEYLVVSSGQDGCERSVGGVGPVPFWFEVFDTENWETVAFIPLATEFRAGPLPRWDDGGTLHAMRPYEDILRFAPDTFEPLAPSGATGMGDVAPRGDRYFSANAEAPGGSDFAAYVFDAETGLSQHVLFDEGTYVSLPLGLTATDDGLVIVGSVTRYTYVYDAFSFQELARLETGELWSSAWDAGNQRLYTTSSGPGVSVWNLGARATGVEGTLDLGPYQWVNGNSFHPGDSVVAMDSISFEIGWAVQAFDPETGARIGDAVGEDVAIATAAGDRFVVTRRSGPTVDVDGAQRSGHFLWDPRGGTVTDLIACHEIMFDEFGDRYCGGEDEPKWYWYVAADGSDEIWAFGSDLAFDWETRGDVTILDATSGEPIDRTTIEQWDGFHQSINPRAVRFVTDFWTVGQGRDGIVAHDRWTGDVLWELDGSDKLEVSASRRHVLGQARGVVHVMETEEWTQVISFQVPGSSRGVAFSPDETKVAVGTLESVFVVDLRTGLTQQQVNLPGVSDFVWVDDETLIIGTNDGLFGTLSLSTEAFLAATRARLVRSFSGQECITYAIDPCPTLAELKGE